MLCPSPILGEFKKKYSNIELQLIEYGSKKVELGVYDGTLDIGIVCTTPTKTDIFEFFSFIEDPLRVIVHPEHPLANKKQLDFADLSDESFVSSNSLIALAFSNIPINCLPYILPAHYHSPGVPAISQ